VKNENTLFRQALVVDDEGSLQLLVRAILEHGAFLVDVAPDGVEACERVKKTRYDAIICDIFMPNMDGTAFYRELMRIDEQQARRVIFVTGADLDDDVKAKVKQSGRPILYKPFEIEEFTEAVNLIASCTE